MATIQAYYKLNGNSNDYSGNGYNGTDIGVTYKTSGLKQSGDFPGGTSSYIDTGLTRDGVTNPQISVGFLIKIPSTSVDGAIFGQVGGSITYRFLYIDYVSGNLRFVSLGGGGQVAIISSPPLDKWVYITISNDPNNSPFKWIVLNGGKRNLGTKLSYDGTNRTSFFIGNWHGFSSYPTSSIGIIAEIDEVKIYKGILGIAETKNLYSYYKGFI